MTEKIMALFKKACAEFIGTFVLVFIACGVAAATGGIISALLTEIVLTGIFVYVILNVTDEKSGTSKFAGIVIGLTLTLVHLIGINITGTSVNPARSIATALGDLIFNGNMAALGQVWMFVVAPLIGAVVAAIIYKGLNKEKSSETKNDEKTK